MPEIEPATEMKTVTPHICADFKLRTFYFLIFHAIL